MPSEAELLREARVIEAQRAASSVDLAGAGMDPSTLRALRNATPADLAALADRQSMASLVEIQRQGFASRDPVGAGRR